MAEPDAWSVILHGGAKTVALDRQDANRRGCLAAVSVGAELLREGGSAVEAVEAVIRVLEDDPVFNAGYGSVLNTDGEVEMDAALMEGEGLALGAVAAIQGVRHPISIARLLMPETPVLLVGEGARRFAASRGAELFEPREMISREALASEASADHDTVGCVALDVRGNIAAGTSTGGLTGKMPGRVGDSPLPGCGLYADNELGGVAFSGDGESIARATLAAHAMHALRSSSAQAAADLAIRKLGRVGGEAGAIVLDRRGRPGMAHNSPHFAVALAANWLPEPRAALHRSELEDLFRND